MPKPGVTRMRDISRIPTAPGKKPRTARAQDTPPPKPQQLLQGAVYKKSLGHYDVHMGDRVVACTLSSKLRKHLVYPVADRTSVRPIVMEVRDIQAQDPVAIGDVVYVAPGGPDSGMITDVMPRTRKLSRRAAGPKPLEQVIVANADQLVAVVAGAFPDPSWELLDRYLAAAEEAELPALIVITKADLLDDSAVGDELEAYRRIGYRVLLTSATSGLGIEQCRAELRGRLSVFAGKSGVGKTTLLNTVQPGLGLRVNEVSGVTGKGKHTTTHLQMFRPGDGRQHRGYAGYARVWPVERGRGGDRYPLPRDAAPGGPVPLRPRLHPCPRTGVRDPRRRGRRLDHPAALSQLPASGPLMPPSTLAHLSIPKGVPLWLHQPNAAPTQLWIWAQSTCDRRSAGTSLTVAGGSRSRGCVCRGTHKGCPLASRRQSPRRLPGGFNRR